MAPEVDGIYAVQVTTQSLERQPVNELDEAHRGVLFIAVPHPPRVGTKVQLDVATGEMPPVRLTALVVWSRPPRNGVVSGFRAQLHNPPIDLMERIRTMLESARQTATVREADARRSAIDGPIRERVRTKTDVPPVARPTAPPAGNAMFREGTPAPGAAAGVTMPGSPRGGLTSEVPAPRPTPPVAASLVAAPPPPPPPPPPAPAPTAAPVAPPPVARAPEDEDNPYAGSPSIKTSIVPTKPGLIPARPWTGSVALATQDAVPSLAAFARTPSPAPTSTDEDDEVAELIRATEPPARSEGPFQQNARPPREWLENARAAAAPPPAMRVPEPRDPEAPPPSSYSSPVLPRITAALRAPAGPGSHAPVPPASRAPVRSSAHPSYPSQPIGRVASVPPHARTEPPNISVKITFSSPRTFLLHYERFFEHGEIYVAQTPAPPVGTVVEVLIDVPDGDEPLKTEAVVRRPVSPPDVPRPGWVATFVDMDGAISERLATASFIVSAPTTGPV